LNIPSWDLAIDPKSSLRGRYYMKKNRAALLAIIPAMIFSISCDKVIYNDLYKTLHKRDIAFVSNRDGNYEIYTMNMDGTEQTRVTNNSATDDYPALSPTGTRIAFASNRDGDYEIYVMNSDGSGVTQLTFNASNDSCPRWSPDGTKIAFHSDRDGNEEVYVMNRNGSVPINITNNANLDGEPSWSPDGTKIIFTTDRATLYTDIFVTNSDGSGIPARLTPSNDTDQLSTWSPDGVYIAYTRMNVVDYYIVRMDSNGTNHTDLTLIGGTINRYPSWTPDSRIVFYSNRPGGANDNEIYIMDYDGSNPTSLTDNTADDRNPSCSPFF
jgi:Tol biopolymer transport system component